MDHDTDVTPTEADPRFPSGPWFGFYRQRGVQSRQRFTLTFRAGRVDGEGKDPVAPFTVRGTYDVDSGRVSLTKSYGQYRVHYTGSATADGIPGTWEIRYAEFGLAFTEQGEFHIWPDELAMEEARKLHAAEPVGI